MKEKNNDQTKEKKKSIDIKALMNTDLGTLKAKLSKGLKKQIKLAPQKKEESSSF